MNNQKETKAQIIGGAICGCLMILSVIVYLIVGLTTNLWHPCWLIPACSGLTCGIIGVVTNTIAKLNNIKNDDQNTEKKQD